MATPTDPAHPLQELIARRAEEIRERAAALRQRVDAAARAAGRAPAEIAVVAVTKTHSASAVAAAAAAGLRDYGENYVQEALAKQDELSAGQLPALPVGARWHLIGHLQSNKASAVAGRFALIHGVDSVKLAERLGRAALAAGGEQGILLQVKLGDEATKSGVEPDHVAAVAAAVAAVPGVRLRGLMAVAPLGPDGSLVTEPRPYFARARGLFEALPAEQREVLSMGMSGDFEPAIAEGATLIRVGTSLFGHRPNRA